MQNIITKKIKYSTDNETAAIILSYIKNYNNALRFTYNRLKENPKLKNKDLAAMHRDLSNIFLDVRLLNSAIYDARALINKFEENKIIFGGRKLFEQRRKNEITREQWQLRRLRPLYHVGNKTRKGNSKFQIIDESTILFKPKKDVHLFLKLQVLTRKMKDELKSLIQAQESKVIPITYRIDTEYIYISYDYTTLKECFKHSKKVKGRVLALDLNPNYIGYSVVDWKGPKYKVIEKGVYSFKFLNNFIIKGSNRDYWCNKSRHEIKELAQKLVKQANYYGCEIFGTEKINKKVKDNKKGKLFNILCNNIWNRELFTQQVKKYCPLYKIHVQEVEPAYSSFVGNLLFRSENAPDMVLSSMEIGRRAYEFYHQYVSKDKQKVKNIVFPTEYVHLNRVKKSLEELKYPIEYKSLKDLYFFIKEKESPRQRYRVSLDDVKSLSCFRKFYNKKKIETFLF